jgi:hypothetical protein
MPYNPRERKSIVCNCERQFDFEQNQVLTDTYIDIGIIVVSGCGEVIKFFRDTMRVCIVGGDNCGKKTSGRGEDTVPEHVTVTGFLAGCDDSYGDIRSITIFPTNGTTAQELKYQILNAISRID